MSYESVEILIQGFQWEKDVEAIEQNFFSSAVPVALDSERNAMPVLSLTNTPELKIKRTFDTVDEENGKFTLFHETEQVRLSFIDYKYFQGTTTTPSTFFKCFENTEGCKWLVKIYHNGLPKWWGVTKPEHIKYDNGDLSVNIEAYGIEKEFAEYYTNKKLIGVPSFTTTDNVPYSYFDTTEQRIKTKHLEYATFQGFMGDNFPAGQINFAINTTLVGDWNVNWFPLLITLNPLAKMVNYDFLLIKGGYKKLYEEGVTRLSWLAKTCNSMGWQFFFDFIGDKLFLFVVPRSRNNLTYTQNLDYNDINPSWTVGKRGVKERFEYVEIPCGSLDGGDEMFFEPSSPNLHDFDPNNLKGNRISILSDIVSFNNKAIHFNRFVGGDMVADVGYKTMRKGDEDDNTYKVIQWDAGLGNYNEGVETVFDVPKSSLLRLDSGQNNSKYVMVRNLGVHFDHEDGFAVGDGDLLMKGCYGDLLFQSLGSGVYKTYSDYVLTDEFRLNLLPYITQTTNIDAEFNIKGIYSNAYVTSQIQNTTGAGVGAFNGRYLASSEVEIDLFREDTTLSVFETEI